MIDTPMKKMITRLFDEAAALENNQLVDALRAVMPANAQPVFLECQLVLKSGYSVAGVLTRVGDPEVLRLVSPAQKQDKTMIMADHYFDYSEVLTIVIGRELPKQLVQPVGRSNGGSIILGH
jgi:hypothetical protein